MGRLKHSHIHRYKNMALLPIMDNLLYNIQRQGKISFYVRFFPNNRYLIHLVISKLDDRCARNPFILCAVTYVVSVR